MRFARNAITSVFAVMLTIALLAATPSGNSPARAEESGANLWSNVQKAGVLRCGAAVYPPYVMRDPASGAYSGIFPDLCRQFAEEVLKVKAEFVDTTWDNLVAGLQANKWDLALALNRTPQRALAVTFSEQAIPYQVSILYNKSNPKIPAGASSLQSVDLKGVTIAVVSGTSMDKSVTPLVKNATILRLPSNDEARLAVISRRADILPDPSESNDLFVEANKDWATAFVPTPAISKQGMAFGMRRDVPAPDITALNIFLEEKIATGQIDALLKASLEQALKDSK